MAGISKRTSGSWVSGDYGIMKTATDTITTLPAVIYPNASTVTVGLKGNTVQNGTPTPQNPVDVNGTGERTGNLVEDYIADCNIRTDGRLIRDTSFNMFVAKVVQGQEYSLDAPLVCGFFTSKPSIGSTSYNNARDTSSVRRFVAPIDGYITFRKASTETTAMLNTGSTALPYEPYGYKIPISCGGTTTPVYLGEVETTRAVKKVVFDGTESWNLSKQVNNTRAYTPQILECLSLSPSICSHFAYNVANVGYPRVGEFVINSSKAIIFGVDSVYTTAVEWKAYLAAQYANGTPVTVWYVLATPQTAIVNEPLMRIGDYADSLTTSIPCAAGENTLDVQTTVQPSEVIAGFSGWHPATVHERTNGAWT